ncbi:Zinc/iron permease [Microdochium trichocladiopsis]|uniref:Zinc/iron permease n=1 Tax=Microdochium trichocladiopsis TaxID=1682393 RepID=A0A9P8XW25_9PEZI|nr:Zinc/iron permease [Microdochium trichocladiopsis]KAH7020992.1 Zinc/iron permease [Microdochium trichocladiopsis]
MDTSGLAPLSAIVKRANTCASGDETVGQYDMPLRIGAVFIILFVSASACAFPLLASRLPGLRMPSDFFFSVRHFGTGVLIATAFCHLLPTGFTLLHDPCLDSWWTEGYPAMPGAIALGAVIFVTAIEMWMHPGRHHHTSPAANKATPPRNRQKGQFVGRARSMGRSLSFIGGEKGTADRITSGVLVNDPETAQRNKNGTQTAVDDGADNNSENDIDVVDNHDANRDVHDPRTTNDDSDSTRGLTPEQKRKREIAQCFLLEMGILFHSVFIGMALSVALGGSQFVVLLIAISFHQTFEGLALGARIAAIDWPEKKSMQPWLMALAYGCTTPLGQAIGLATRSAYSPDSEVGLILVGVMNSISSGLLIFASLVELLSEDLLSDESWKILQGKRRVCAFLLVIAGAFGMSLVGAWA